jgi:glycosyltransferase involved in cell wall biosynthesis
MVLITGLGVGGAEAVVHDLAMHLDRARFTVTVVTLLPRGEMGDQLEAAGIRCIALGTGTHNPVTLVMRLIRLLRTIRPEILHTHLFHADTVGRIAGRIAGVPVIVSSLHNVTFGGKAREVLLGVTRSLVTRFIAVANVVRHHAVSHGIAPIDRTETVYNGIDTTRFANVGDKKILRQKLGLPVDATILISVGRLIEQKGYLQLLAALAHVRSGLPGQDVRLILLGEGSDREALRAVAALLPPETVVMPGAVLNVPEYLAAADMFIMSSLWEGFSLAVVEAAMVGLPIVATSVGIVPEFIRDGESGRIVAPGDTVALSNAILGILRLLPTERALMASRSQEIARTLFSVSVMTHAHEQLYEKLLHESR